MKPSEKLAEEIMAMLEQAAADTGLSIGTICVKLRLGGDFYTRVKKSGAYNGRHDTVHRIMEELPVVVSKIVGSSAEVVDN